MDISFEDMKALNWNKQWLDVLGLWPLNLNNVKFSFFFTYLTVQCLLQYANLVQYISDLSHVVVNLTEIVVLTMIFLKIVIHRINVKRLHALIQDIQKDYSNELYKTANEVTIFLEYNSLTKTVVQCLSTACAAATLLFYIQPLPAQLLAYNDYAGNSAREFILPYHIRLFFDLTEARTYYIIYACEILVVPIATCGYAGPSCLLIILVLHICGQISVLTCRVKNLVQDPKTLHHQLKEIVIKHRQVISLCIKLNSTYSTFLLQEVVGITLLLCLGSYNIIASSTFGKTEQLLTFSCYVITVTIQLLSFCYMGECLKNECVKFCDAFYNNEWYNVSTVHRKLFLMCVIRSQRPLVLTAGKFFTFSLESFTTVMKTSMAYLSVLRNFI